MGLFSRNKELEELNKKLTNSFAKVKQDINQLFSWLNYLYYHQQKHNQDLNELKLEIKYLPKREEIRELVDFYYSQTNKDSSLANELSQLRDIVFDLASNQKDVFKKLELLSEKIKTLEKPKTNFKEKLIKRIARSSKDYIKNLILSLIQKYEKISALKLREIVVEEQALCSKSSFYRILEELEKERQIHTLHKGKIKYVLFKARKNTIL